VRDDEKVLQTRFNEVYNFLGEISKGAEAY
jgi:hypothetical protein